VATWADVKGFIHSNYKGVSDINDTLLSLLFEAKDLRSQQMFVQYTPSSGGMDWVEISSPVGKITEVDLPLALREVSEKICGGLSAVGDLLVVRHMVPLANVDGNEIAVPLGVLSGIADDLEKVLTGGDAY
jgi:hypothetical protein